MALKGDQSNNGRKNINAYWFNRYRLPLLLVAKKCVERWCCPHDFRKLDRYLISGSGNKILGKVDLV